MADTVGFDGHRSLRARKGAAALPPLLRERAQQHVAHPGERFRCGLDQVGELLMEPGDGACGLRCLCTAAAQQQPHPQRPERYTRERSKSDQQLGNRAGVIAHHRRSGAARQLRGELGLLARKTFQKLHLVCENLAVLQNQILREVRRVGHRQQLHICFLRRARVFLLVAVAAGGYAVFPGGFATAAHRHDVITREMRGVELLAAIQAEVVVYVYRLQCLFEHHAMLFWVGAGERV